MLRATALLLALTVAACTGEGAGFGPGASVRDSAGVTIVRNRAPLWPADSGWRVADTPSVVIGGREGMGVTAVAGAVRTPGGGIAVADGGIQAIRVFNTDGRFLRTLGRRGSGPGEFQAITWIANINDSILAFDLVSRRLTMFGSTGRVGVASLEAGTAMLTSPLDHFRDGSLLVAAGGPVFPFSGAEGAVQRDSALLLVHGPGGGVRDTVARVAWGESFGVAIGRGEQRFLAPMPRPFARRTSAVVLGAAVAVGEADAYDIAVYAAGGKLERRIRRERPPVPVSPEAVQGFKEAQHRGRSDQGMQAQVDAALGAALDSAPFPSVLPVYERIAADAAGNLWVLDYGVRRDQPGTWSVFNPQGRWLGTVRTPARLRVEQIGSDWVLGVWDDGAGGEQVRMYRLVKP